jgi:LmbE family N-acetylglucosaminyl deacetylase
VAVWDHRGSILVRPILPCIAVLLFLMLPWTALARETVIWYLPHPDDETIGMADSIVQSVQAGNTNYFIYFSHGAGSLARHDLQGPDGRRIALTREEFGAARMRETLAALQALGVDPSQVLFLDYPDGSIPPEAVQRIMRLFAELYPGSIHRTVSVLDPHEDHQTLARALRELASEDKIDIHPEFFHVYIHRRRDLPAGVEKRPIQHREVKERALAELSLWDPEQGRYGIAARSTPDLVEAAARSPYEYVDAMSKEGIASRSRECIPGVSMSNRDLGIFLRLEEKFSLDAFFEYATQALGVEINWRLRDEIPLVQLVLGVGYHFGYNKPYLSSKVEIAQNYFLRVRHVFPADTSVAIGLSTRFWSR